MRLKPLNCPLCVDRRVGLQLSARQQFARPGAPAVVNSVHRCSDGSAFNPSPKRLRGPRCRRKGRVSALPAQPPENPYRRAFSGQAPVLRGQLFCPTARSRRSNLQQGRFPALAALRAQRWRQFHCSAAQRSCVGNSSPHCSQRVPRADCSAALKPTPKQLRRQRFRRDWAEDPLRAQGLQDGAQMPRSRRSRERVFHRAAPSCECTRQRRSIATWLRPTAVTRATFYLAAQIGLRACALARCACLHACMRACMHALPGCTRARMSACLFCCMHASLPAGRHACMPARHAARARPRGCILAAACLPAWLHARMPARLAARIRASPPSCARIHASAHACARACLPACAHSRIPSWLHARMHVRLPDWPCMHASPPAWLHACMPALHAARARLPARHARSWPRRGGLRARARAASRAGLHARSQAGRHARMQLGGQARSCRAARLARARPGAQASCKHAATRVGVRALRGGQACRHAARRAGLRTCSNAGKHARAAMRAAMRACSHAGRLARMQPDGQADRHARPPAWRHARMPAHLAARMPACTPCCMHACNLMLSEATQCNLM